MPFAMARWDTVQRVSSRRSYAEEMGARSSLWTTERPAMSILQSKLVVVVTRWTNVLFRCTFNEPKAVIISFACAVKLNSAINVAIDFVISNSSVGWIESPENVNSLDRLLGDHYSELSVLGCKYRFYPDRPVKRRLIRGSILGGKILAAPVVLCFAVVAGTVCATVGLPAYCCVMLARHIKVTQHSSYEGNRFSFFAGKTTTSTTCDIERTCSDELYVVDLSSEGHPVWSMLVIWLS